MRQTLIEEPIDLWLIAEVASHASADMLSEMHGGCEAMSRIELATQTLIAVIAAFRLAIVQITIIIIAICFY